MVAVFLAAATNAGAFPRVIPTSCKDATASKLCAIHVHYHKTNHYRGLLGLPKFKYGYGAERFPHKRNHILDRWIKRQWKWHQRYKHAQRTGFSAHVVGSVRANLMCIHSHEGAWDANTGNGYYGGLQMDASFEQAYGPEFVARYGHANNWPVEAQLTAGARAVQSRGYGPWPNTAAMCGLL